MFQLAMVVMSLCLMRGDAGVGQIGDQVMSRGASIVRETEGGGETGAITVTVELPKIISHIDCPPPKITRHDIEQRRRRSVHN